MTRPTEDLTIRNNGRSVRVYMMRFPSPWHFASPVLLNKKLGASSGIMIMSCARAFTIPTGTLPGCFDDIVRKRYSHDVSSLCDRLILSPNNKNVNIKSEEVHSTGVGAVIDKIPNKNRINICKNGRGTYCLVLLGDLLFWGFLQ